jgi:hypothetical protein
MLTHSDDSDEIGRFLARETDRVERVKLRRRQHQVNTMSSTFERLLPAFSNPNYVPLPMVNEKIDESLAHSILV